jgi:hypothetical protein
MRAFWDYIVKPLLELVSPRIIVEVGTFNGDTTKKLLEFAAGCDCVVHTIDPNPGNGFDLDGLRELYMERLVFHHNTSLAALPEIEGIGAALLDGDHNWYTVYNELRLLGERPSAGDGSFPLTLLHDVDWPYGRRDLYYDPETIPEDSRQPFERAGLVPGRAPLAEDGGINAGLRNAVMEGTPRNGVRTAVEDFLAQTDLELHFQDIPGLHGLGIIVPRPLLAENAELTAQLEQFESSEWLAAHCRRIEDARVRMQASFQHRIRKLRLTGAEREGALRAKCERLMKQLGGPEEAGRAEPQGAENT